MVEGLRNRIKVRSRRKSLVIRGVKHRNLWNVGKQVPCRFNSHNVHRVVKGCKAGTFVYGSNNVVINERGFAEGFPSMNHPVTNGSWNGRHQLTFPQGRNQCLQSLFVIGTGRECYGSVVALDSGKSILAIKALGCCRCELLISFVEQREFKG